MLHIFGGTIAWRKVLKKKTVGWIVTLGLVFAVLLYGSYNIAGYLNFILSAAPASNPASGNATVYVNSTTNLLSCLTSAGANCMPAGYQRGTTAARTACSSVTNGRLYHATDSPLAYGCNGTSDQAYDGTVAVTPPGLLSNYTSVTVSGATITQVGDAVSLDYTGSNGYAYGFYSSAPVTTSSVVAAAFDATPQTGNNQYCGPGIYSTPSQSLVFGDAIWVSGGIVSAGAYNQGIGTTFGYALGSSAQTSNVQFRLRFSSATVLNPEMSTNGGQTWFNPLSGSTFNVSGFTNKYMGVFCNNNSGSNADTHVTITHFTAQ